MDTFIQLLFWPILFVVDSKDLFFSIAFLIYAAYFVVPILGFTASLAFLSKWKALSAQARAAWVIIAILSLTIGFFVYSSSLRGEISLDHPILSPVYGIIGPTLVGIGLLMSKHIKKIFGNVAKSRIGLITLGCILTYFVSGPILVYALSPR